MKYFFIGIKGSGMSALASILKDMQEEVEGSDYPKNFFTEKNLRKKKIKIYDFGEADFEGVDEIILGNSFKSDNIDYINAKSKNIKITPYFEALNKLANKYTSIAVAGANGKTTTTGLLRDSLKDENISYLIGDGTGYGNKKADKFVFEACEYKNTFLNYTPTIGLINNIEFDHPDFFKDIKDMINTFSLFAKRCEILVINGDDKNCKTIKHSNKYTFGLNENNNLYAKDITYKSNGIEFYLIYNQQNIGKYILPFFGEYMLLNSLGVILINLLLNKDIESIIKNLSKFSGVDRRFSTEVLSSSKNIYLIDDYAHHPQAIKQTIKAIRQKYPLFYLVSIFQPHTQARVDTFFKEFAYELSKSDKIIITKTFKAAREKEVQKVDNKINNQIIKLGFKDKLIDFENLKDYKENFVICLFGAGDIDIIYKEKIKKLEI